MPTPARLTHVTKSDYAPPEEGWSILLARRGRQGIKAYLQNTQNLLPYIRKEFEALRRDYPSARIIIDEEDPYLLYPDHHFPVEYGSEASGGQPPPKKVA